MQGRISFATIQSKITCCLVIFFESADHNTFRIVIYPDMAASNAHLSVDDGYFHSIYDHLVDLILHGSWFHIHPYLKIVGRMLSTWWHSCCWRCHCDWLVHELATKVQHIAYLLTLLTMFTAKRRLTRIEPVFDQTILICFWYYEYSMKGLCQKG